MSPPQLCLLALAGSRAHGTDDEQSDVDVVGAALPNRQQLIGLFERFEQHTDEQSIAPLAVHLLPEEQEVAQRTKLEGSVFELRKLLRLVTEANPNLLELLFVRDSEIRFSNSAGMLLLEHRDLFLTEKCRHTFGGYALSQLKRIQLHHRWHHGDHPQAPRRSDFELPEASKLSRDQVAAVDAEVRKQLERWQLDMSGVEPALRIEIEQKLSQLLAELNLSTDESLWTAAARWIGVDDNLLEILARERRWSVARSEWKRYQTWLKNRNPERAALEAAHGYDTKHAAHLVRLLRMGREVLETGLLRVWRGDLDADELRAIRAGAWSYDRLLQWAQEERDRLASATAIVPAHTDRDAVERLCMELLDRGE
ncbi:MAG: nucleotidyltransferase domain-containing protein [Acidobacteriota bacterium]